MRRTAALWGALCLAPVPALAQAGGGGQAAGAAGGGGAPASSAAPPPPASAAAPAGDKKVWTSCSEYVPKGATKPVLATDVPARALSGYAVWLDVTVTHGRGETVMPGGFQIQRGSDAMRALRDAGWAIPAPEGGVAPRIEPDEASGESTTMTTRLSLPFVALPKEPGRHHLTLPPVPITVARANGQVMTVCTEPRTVTIDDPIANEVDPKVKPNPPPRPQREEWVAAKQATVVALAALVLAALLTWLIRRWLKQPKPAPPKPRVLPWIWAMQELQRLKARGIDDDARYDQLIDEVSDITRRYLGERYGFDGLESTSAEIRRTLKRVYPPLTNLPDIDRFLEDTDLVKFAKVEARREDCEAAIARAEAIVQRTTPAAVHSQSAKRPSRRAA